MECYAITSYGGTKDKPFALVAMINGVFYVHIGDDWVPTDRYYGILNGSFIDYEKISEKEAIAILQRQIQDKIKAEEFLKQLIVD